MQNFIPIFPKSVLILYAIVYNSIRDKQKEEMGDMSKRIDLTGQRFGRLVVVSRNEEVSKQKGCSHWNCICDCGNEKVVWGQNLKRGSIISCGCLKNEKAREMWKDEEFKQMISNKMKQKWEDEEFKQKNINATKEMWKDEEFRQMKSNKMRELNEKQWKDEEFRQMQSEKRTRMNEEMWQDEEFRQMKSETSSKWLKDKWQDEEFRQIQKNIHWKGGITPISTYLRMLSVVGQWRKYTYEQANYKCQLTGKKVHGGNSDVHHLYAFSSIVMDAHNTYNIEVKPQVKDYTKGELKLLEDYVAEWHKDSSNAVLLSVESHALFHSLYGKGNNTPEQYEEFKQRYINGEFKDLI